VREQTRNGEGVAARGLAITKTKAHRKKNGVKHTILPESELTQRLRKPGREKNEVEEGREVVSVCLMRFPGWGGKGRAVSFKSRIVLDFVVILWVTEKNGSISTGALLRLYSGIGRGGRNGHRWMQGACRKKTGPRTGRGHKGCTTREEREERLPLFLVSNFSSNPQKKEGEKNFHLAVKDNLKDRKNSQTRRPDRQKKERAR